MNLQNRKKIRLHGYNYSQNGCYFITICAHNRQYLFGEIINEKIILNDYGHIVHQTYIDLPNHNENVKLDKFIIMPNHIHCIIAIENPLKYLNNTTSSNGISEIIRQLKTFSTKRINIFRKENGLEPFPANTIWQKSYNDHIIRCIQEYEKIQEYINLNPSKWQHDCYM